MRLYQIETKSRHTSFISLDPGKINEILEDIIWIKKV